MEPPPILDDDPMFNNVVILSIDKVAELEKTGIGAQYIVVPSNNYNSESVHYDLCGHLSFTAIYETVTGIKGLGMIWDLYPTVKGSYFATWVNTINSLPGWSAESHWIDWRDPQKHIEGILSNGTYIILGCTLDKETGLLVKNSLDVKGQERYVGHFVVLYGSSDYGVMIYNPYTNTTQVYSWEEMKECFGVMILVNYKEPEGIKKVADDTPIPY